MSIPALGGGANQALQRALRDAERALAGELSGSADGDDPTAVAQAAAGGAAAALNRAVRRRVAGSDAQPQPQDEAIVVELGDPDKADGLKVAGGWITTAKRPLETKGMPESKRFDGADVKAEPDEAGAAEGRTPAARTQRPGPAPQAPQPPSGGPATPVAPGPGQAATSAPSGPETAPGTPSAVTAEAAPARPQADQGVSLDRLIVVLKKTGIGFRDAYQVLREINAGGPLPPKSELQARWAAADPEAWEERARTQAAPARPQSTPTTPEQPAARTADADLRQTAVDDLIRDRAWRRENAEAERAGNGLSVRDDDARPTLQTIVRHDPTNQAYVAGLSTAEFQRLVTVLGRTAPEWFWELRGHRGLRGLAERPAVARLNTTRFAGTRLGAWILAVTGTGTLWYLGIRTGHWW